MIDLSKYMEIRGEMKTGDLLQWRSNSLIGALIRWKTHSNMNHSSLVIRFQNYEGKKKERRFTTEALEHGTVTNLLSRRLETFDGEVWWYPLKGKFEFTRDSIGEKAMELIGLPYDYKSIFEQMFCKVSANARQLFCSEYCYLSYLYGIGDGIKRNTAPTPAEMTDLGIFNDPVKIL